MENKFVLRVWFCGGEWIYFPKNSPHQYPRSLAPTAKRFDSYTDAEKAIPDFVSMLRDLDIYRGEEFIIQVDKIFIVGPEKKQTTTIVLKKDEYFDSRTNRILKSCGGKKCPGNDGCWGGSCMFPEIIKTNVLQNGEV